jgi:hypothetical protein
MNTENITENLISLNAIHHFSYESSGNNDEHWDHVSYQMNYTFLHIYIPHYVLMMGIRVTVNNNSRRLGKNTT